MSAAVSSDAAASAALLEHKQCSDPLFVSPITAASHDEQSHSPPMPPSAESAPIAADLHRATVTPLERRRNPQALLRFHNAAMQVRAQLDRSKLGQARASSRHALIEAGLHLMFADSSEATRIAVAAMLVSNSQNGTYDPAWFKRSAGWRKVHDLYANRWFRAIRFAMVFVFMIMQFWEEPVWCRTMSPSTIFFNSYQNYASIALTYPQQAAVARGEPGISPQTNPEPASLQDMPACGAPLVYLLSNLRYWPIEATLVIELLLLLGLLLSEVLLRLWMLSASADLRGQISDMRNEIRRDRSISVMLVLFALCIVDICVSFGCIETQTVRLVPLLRPMLFVSLVPSVRDCFVSLVRGLPITVDVLCLLWILIAVWSWICLLLFNPVNSLQGTTYFSDLQEALWTIQANYPDMQLPAYNVHRSWIMLFVGSFALASYFLLPLVLANIFVGFSQQQAAAARQFQARRIKGLTDAFLILDTNKCGHVDFDVIMSLLMEMLGLKAGVSSAKRHEHSLARHGSASGSGSGPGASGAVAHADTQVEMMQPIHTVTVDCNNSSPTHAAAPATSPLSRLGVSVLDGLSGVSSALSELERKRDARIRARIADKAKRYFDLLDSDHSGTVQQAEFHTLCTILTTQLHTLAPPLLPLEWALWSDPRFLRFVDFLQRPWRWDLCMALVTAFNLCVIVAESIYVRDNPVQTGAGMIYSYCSHSSGGGGAAGVIKHAAVLHGLEWLCLCLYLLDVCVKVFCLGWSVYRRDARYVFELLLTLLSLVSEVVLLIPSLGCNENVYALVMVLRVLRILRLLLFFTRFYLIMAVYIRLLPRFLSIVGLLVALYYWFASLGVFLFGGRMYIGNPRQLGACYDDSCNYYAINANDFGMAMGALFQLMVLSNWHLQVDGFVLATSRWARLFFLAFYYTAVVIGLNLCIAFLLDTFVSEWKEARREEKDRNKARKTARRDRGDEANGAANKGKRKNKSRPPSSHAAAAAAGAAAAAVTAHATSASSSPHSVVSTGATPRAHELGQPTMELRIHYD